jgi:hypothetical protein
MRKPAEDIFEYERSLHSETNIYDDFDGDLFLLFDSDSDFPTNNPNKQKNECISHDITSDNSRYVLIVTMSH